MTVVHRVGRRLRRVWPRQHGQILVFAALIIAIVLGMGALATDVGFYLHERQSVQNAVDAGALAGAALLPTNGSGAATAAMTFTLANDPHLTSGNVNISFRCLVSNVAQDVPGWCDPKADASWTTSSTGLQVSPCIPANGDVCNVIVDSATSTQKYYLAPAIGIKNGSTGTITSAACAGACGEPPSKPVDIALVMDRTGSMSSGDLSNARAAATAMFETWNAGLQWVAYGLLGPSQNTTSPCSGSPTVYANAASTTQYDTTTVAKWMPVGLTGVGATGANQVNENYLNANGTLNTSSHIIKALNCFNTSGTGTNLATPIKMAKQFLQANGRPNVHEGIIFETDGNPNYNGRTGDPTNYTCAQAETEATAAKALGIEIYTIGFGLAGTDLCPDTSGTYKGLPATKILADMATNSVDNGCGANANPPGTHAFCLPKTQQLTSIFQAIAGSIAAGSMLITPP